ncbi:two-component sensor histidine kinase [Capnocytophaga catalasegens]|uniref:histidine kinase n=2 Tax=Capnocytophaga catalasegens TaxID=1004260 RepID=A0AAV5AXC1_9FLAO|nr:two-component sensor histidine kinase [Capnocytophaga catalasegens]GJM50198.1 two-component sensor histidine kinase [Capnocytophaga catalasegens]GJM52039.1 two-component sensor histidine kinase [Capnocytophaga catalasegens]
MVSMILFVVVAFAVIALVTTMQYKKQSVKYHKERLLHKEKQIKTQIQYTLLQTTFPVEAQYIPLIFKDEIYRISNIQNVNFNLYDLQGTLLKSSRAVLDERFAHICIPDSILNALESAVNKRYIEHTIIDKKGYQSSYSYVNDNQFKPILILHIPNFENDSFNESSLRNSLYNLSMVYVVLLIIAVVLAYFISTYITKSLKTIEKRLTQTQFLEHNEKIILENPSAEIGQLITAYNSMIDEIERNKQALAKNERERAWREMAKQIAHEIKNPLTPMRLSIQSFERKFDPNSPNAHQKLTEFSQTLIQQIDTLSSIASAFSTFTQMPEQQREYTDVVKIVQNTIDIFDKECVFFQSEVKKIIAFVDKNQINRVVTNLLKNSLQATSNLAKPYIEVLLRVENKELVLSVRDNGMGISPELQEKIFEPKFTTKSTGSGLGLAMVKNIVQSYQGRIELISELNKGAMFVIYIPL